MTAGGQQSGLVHRKTVLKSHKLNAFSSQYVHQSVLEQDTEVLACPIYFLLCKALLFDFVYSVIYVTLFLDYLTYLFTYLFSTVEIWDSLHFDFMDLVSCLHNRR